MILLKIILLYYYGFYSSNFEVSIHQTNICFHCRLESDLTRRILKKQRESVVSSLESCQIHRRLPVKITRLAIPT